MEKESFAREKTDFDSACVEEQNKLEQERDDFAQSINRIGNHLKFRSVELDQRDKDQNKRNEEQDERNEELSEVQKLLDDQVVKQQKKATELKQKECELEQKGDAIAAVKKEIMDYAEEIAHDLLELGRVEQKIDRNKHLLFSRGEREKDWK